MSARARNSPKKTSVERCQAVQGRTAAFISRWGSAMPRARVITLPMAYWEHPNFPNLCESHRAMKIHRTFLVGGNAASARRSPRFLPVQMQTGLLTAEYFPVVRVGDGAFVKP
jgi:hypothetical protein